MRFLKNTRKKVGLAPGTLMHIGEKKTDQVRITLTEFDPDSITEREISAVDAVSLKDDCGSGKTVSWINVDGIHDVTVIEAIGSHFNIHPLILEDILNTGQRPKVDEHDQHLYLVLKMLYYDDVTHRIQSEQLSLILGDGYLLSFQEKQGDVFDPVRQRIRKGKGRIRKNGCDYLAYALLDAVVDHYFVVLEKINVQTEDMEEALLDEASPETLQQIHAAKKELIFFHKQIWPLRDILAQIRKGDLERIDDINKLFFNDVHDHIVQAVDISESLRDILKGQQDLYLSTLSHKMNEVMKVLTIIATLFIPLTFVAGIYGMNFQHMPELAWRWGYPAVWGVMGVLAVGMIVYFKKNKWL